MDEENINPEPISGKLVQIAAFDNQYQADLAKTLLESNGITVCIEDANAVSVLPHLSFMLGGIKILVLEENEEEAKDIIKDISRDWIKRKKDESEPEA